MSCSNLRYSVKLKKGKAFKDEKEDETEPAVFQAPVEEVDADEGPLGITETTVSLLLYCYTLSHVNWWQITTKSYDYEMQ